MFVLMEHYHKVLLVQGGSRCVQNSSSLYSQVDELGKEDLICSDPTGTRKRRLNYVDSLLSEI